MNNNYEPSFEVVDKAEEAEDYLLSKIRRKEVQPDTVDTIENHNTNNNSNVLRTDDTMKLNSFPIKEDVSVVRNEVKQNVENVDCVEEDNDIIKCVTEEEGQEALWLEETAMSPATSSGSVSPAVKLQSKRSSFIFGSSKKVATISPKRSISFRKKNNQPKVMLLDGDKNASPAFVPIVSDETVCTNKEASSTITKAQPDGVIASDTISSLGFDKSFDVRSPLSMSSLNEILDAPLTPTAEESAVVQTTDLNKKTKKKSIIRGMLQKKEKIIKAKKSFSFGLNRSRYARAVTIVEKEDNDDDAVIMDPALLATRDINERIQASLLRAMENDDAQSLTSYNGVPVIMKEVDTKTKKDKPRTLTILSGQKPLNFDKVKPTFVGAKDSLTMSEIQEKFVPMYDDDAEEEYSGEVKDLESPSSTVESTEEDRNVEPLKSCSPNSNGDDSALTDRYTVTRGVDDDFESDDDDGKSDKYSVIPDPCSLCDSFWISTDNQQTVSKTMTESPDTKTDPNSDKSDNMLDSPVLDKYAELPEVVATESSGTTTRCVANEGVFTSMEKSTTTNENVVASKSNISSVFGKFRTSSVSTKTPAVVSANNIGVVSNETIDTALEVKDVLTTDELTFSNTDHSTNLASSEETTVTSKGKKSSFFGKIKRQATSKSMSCEATADPTISAIESSMNASSIQDVSNITSYTSKSSKVAPKKSILKKRKEAMTTPSKDSNDSIIVHGKNLESPGAKISVLSLGSEHYTIPPADANTSSNFKSNSVVEQHPIEDPSTEGSSSAEDETNAKIVSISPSTKVPTDPLLARLCRNFHHRASPQKRGIDPQTDVDPIIDVGATRTRLDP
jgi:hypothetical protein